MRGGAAERSKAKPPHRRTRLQRRRRRRNLKLLWPLRRSRVRGSPRRRQNPTTAGRDGRGGNDGRRIGWSGKIGRSANKRQAGGLSRGKRGRTPIRRSPNSRR